MLGVPSRLDFSASIATIVFLLWTNSGAQDAGEACITDEFTWRNTVSMQCSFHDEAGVSLWCDELARAYDYAPFVTFPFYVHTRYEFVGSEAADFDGRGNMTMCLGLRKITMQKLTLTEPWKNLTTKLPEPYKMYLLVGAKEMFLETFYNESVPVGYVSTDRDCWKKNRTSCPPAVIVAEQMLKPVYDTNAYQQYYWDEVKEVRTDILGEHDGKLLVDYQLEFDVSTKAYVEPFLRGTFQLRELRVTGVNLSELGQYLGRMPQLLVLDLSNDNIQALQPEILQNVINVEKLSLAYNKLHSISEQISHLRNLTSLDLSGNPLDTSEEGMKNFTEALKTVGRLQWLYLASINIRKLSTLRPLLGKTGIKLLGLDLSYCGLTSMSGEDAAEIFQAQTELKLLRLAGNRFTEFSPRVFFSLRNLKELNLSSCAITKSFEMELSPYTVLANLDMSHNNLTFPKRIISAGCVEKLDLFNNSIKSWCDTDSFQPKSRVLNCWSNGSITPSQLTSVKNVNLSFNHISTLTSEMMNSLQHLTSVDLGGNPIDCNNCNTPKLQDWIWQAKQSGRPRIVTAGSDKPLVCTTPVNNLGNPVIEVLFDSATCESVNYVLILGVPLTAVAAAITCVIILMYVYRFELTYLMHLAKMKRRRSLEIHNASQNFEYDAFVCYSGSDRAWVIGKLLPRLEQQPTNYRLCLHERDFVLGAFITSNIVTSMQNSRFTIVVLSDSFVQSQWCRWELEMANHKLFEDDSNFLILLELKRLDRSAVPRHLKYLMDTRTYLEWPQDSPDKEHEMWKRLETAMGYSIANGQAVGKQRSTDAEIQSVVSKTV